MEAERHSACRAEISVSQKIMRALGARNINFTLLDRLLVEYRAAIDRISTAETELHDYRVRQEIAQFIRSFFAPSPTPA